MKSRARTATFSITFRYDPEIPNVLSLDGPNGIIGDDLYFSEHDITRAADWLPESLVPKGGKLETNGRNEAWISHWNADVLAAMDDQTFKIRFTEVTELDEDGEPLSTEETSEVMTDSITISITFTPGMDVFHLTADGQLYPGTITAIHEGRLEVTYPNGGKALEDPTTCFPG